MTVRRTLRIVGNGPWALEISSWITQDPKNFSTYDFAGCVVPSDDGSISCDPGDHFVMGLLDPREKLKVAALLISKGGVFVSLRHPTSLISLRAYMGQGVILGPSSVVSCDAVVGDFVSIQSESIVGHDARCGDGSTLASRVDVTGFARLGKGVFLAGQTTISPSVELGDFVHVEARSVVIRNVAGGLRVGGIPARTLRVTSP